MKISIQLMLLVAVLVLQTFALVSAGIFGKVFEDCKHLTEDNLDCKNCCIEHRYANCIRGSVCRCFSPSKYGTYE